MCKITYFIVIYYFNFLCRINAYYAIQPYSKSLTLIPREAEKFLKLKCANTNMDNVTDNWILSNSDIKFKAGMTTSPTTTTEADPLLGYQKIVVKFLNGGERNEIADSSNYDDYIPLIKKKHESNLILLSKGGTEDPLRQYPNGQVLRGELFGNKSGVHLASQQFIHTGHARLNVTDDYMQTAVNAFLILSDGDLNDLKALPLDYVLRSARTISMMKLPTEKLEMLWEVVKNGTKPMNIPYHVLEMYRPLFKYINAREVARLNLKDDRILSFIGTHPALGRHKVS